MSVFTQANTIPINEVALKLQLRFKGKMAYCFNGHDKNTASLKIDNRKNVWHCFGCKGGGGVLQLVMGSLDYDIKNAIQWLKKNFPHVNFNTYEQVSLKYKTPIKKAPPPAFTKEYAANPEVYKWILNNTNLSKEGKRYLLERGYTEEIIQKMNLRDIPNPHAFFNLLQNSWKPLQLRQAGLIRENEVDELKFIWWNHIILFPFFSASGEPIYFQGRHLNNNANPRYVNLRGLNKPIYNLQLLPTLKASDEVFFMEGVTDTIAAAQDGLNAFGILGASGFREEFVNDFIKFKIRVIPDNDSAGEGFFKTVKEAFLKVNKNVSLLKVNGYKDYSDYAKQKNGTAPN